MPIKVNFSTPLLKTTGGERDVSLDSKTIEQMIEDLQEMFPDLIRTICDADGRFKNNVSVYLNDDDIRFLDGVKTVINESDEVFIIPIIAGG